MNTNLKDEIAEWDMKSAAAIEAIYDRYSHANNFLDTILAHSENKHLQRGATWLLKHHLTSTPEILTDQQSKTIIAGLNNLDHWESKLHILQIFSHISISENQMKHALTFVRESLGSKKTFVRAWAYSGFYLLSVRFPQFHEEMISLFEDALATESAGSVKARIRQITKKNGLQIG